MPPKSLARAVPMYQQLAAALAERITSGELKPGDRLPSESELMEEHGISRLTVRSAVKELRSMGLVSSQQGVGSEVRAEALPAAVLERGPAIDVQDEAVVPGFVELETPSISRGHAAGLSAALLDRDEPAIVRVDRLLSDAATGARISHTVTIPMDLIEKVPAIQDEPDAAPAALYALCREAGYALDVVEEVTARMPRPDERTALHCPDGAPIMITYRVVCEAESRSPLLLETLRAPADAVRLRISAPSPHRADS